MTASTGIGPPELFSLGAAVLLASILKELPRGHWAVDDESWPHSLLDAASGAWVRRHGDLTDGLS